MTRHNPLLLALAAGAAFAFAPVPAALAQAPANAPATAAAKKPVESADDLPRHTYTIPGKASDFIVSTDDFDAFIAKVRADLESDLDTHDIQDNTTLQQYYTTLQSIALMQGRYDDALAFTPKIRDLETKEAQKLMTGVALQAVVAASKAPTPDAATAALKADLDASLRKLPFDKIREIVTQRRMQMQIASPELIKGQLQSGLDPVVAANKGEVSGELARQLVSMGSALRTMLPHRAAMAEVYGQLIDDNTSAATDIWADRAVALSDSDKLTPVVVAVWDSGVDTKLFPNNLWTNESEKANGKDNDGNGFVADIHGIAFNLDNQPVPELLFPIANLNNSLQTIQKYAGGMSDMQSGIDSPRAAEARKYISSLKPDDVGKFIEDMGQWANYMHGTHVAGITADGNPAARILTARIEFDYRQIPLKAPSMEDAIAGAAAAKKTVDYFKAHNVRVVNMSWGGSRQDIENGLEQKGVGASPAERAELARKIFNTMKEGLDEAIKSAPDILFVAAAGNSNNNAQFSELIPSGLLAPNMITIGAVDQSGKPTGFTTFGDNVKLYASGYQVDSFVPGGDREKASGTSMAAPQVANLAAKLLAINPNLSSAEVVRIITDTADPMPGNNPGRFLINPKNAVAKARESRG